MEIIHKIESLRYDIEKGIETDVINISVRLIQIKDCALRCKQDSVCGISEPKFCGTTYHKDGTVSLPKGYEGVDG